MSPIVALSRWVCIISVIFAMVFVGANVALYKTLGREFFAGGNELVQMAQVLILSGAMLDMVRKGKEIKVGLMDVAGEKIRRIVKLIMHMLESAFGAVLFAKSLQFSHHLWAVGERGAVSGIPVYPFVGAIALAFGLYALLKVAEVISTLCGRWPVRR